MTGAKSIEALSLFFTAGVAAGCFLTGSYSLPLAAMVLPLLVLPFLFQKQISEAPPPLGSAALCATFLLLGAFCRVSASAAGIARPGIVSLASGECAVKASAFIDGIPFEYQRTHAILKAFLLGDRSGLDSATIGVFREAGASHLLALSGLHIGIIYLIFKKLTLPLGNFPASRVTRYVLTVSAALFYTIMTGAGASTVRAFLFIGINETLQLAGRPRRPTGVLCLALLLQLAINPEAISGVGFQLSYLAMAGIFLLYPHLESWYRGRGMVLRKIWKSAALSISCQVFTGPLVWFRFRTFPKSFLLTNLLAIPLTTGLIASALLTAVLSALGICPGVAIKITDGLCRLLYTVLEIISS